MTDASKDHDAGTADAKAAPEADADATPVDDEAATGADADASSGGDEAATGADADASSGGDEAATGADADASSGGDRDATGSRRADASNEQMSSTTDDVTATLQALTRERDTYLDHLRRERAEFENFRRRSQKERMEALDRGAEALLSQLLGVLDNFGYVLEAAKDADDAVAKGVRMVHTELRETLERAGLEDVPGVDAPFDPTWHDAVMQVDGETTDEGEPKVAQVLRNGYRFKGRVLRPASVAVTQ